MLALFTSCPVPACPYPPNYPLQWSYVRSRQFEETNETFHPDRSVITAATVRQPFYKRSSAAALLIPESNLLEERRLKPGLISQEHPKAEAALQEKLFIFTRIIT